jgi:tetratricopeptide (TPR) repeat protein
VIQVGSIIGSYEVVGRLGAGGMGEVFRARDRALGREVALKVVARELAVQPSRAARLRHEARMLAALSHPAIAAIYGLEQADGVPVLVLELVEGTTLADRIRQGPLSVAEAARLGAEIASGLAAAHAAGIIHRDLKPANISLTPDGRIKLLDFGLAKTLLPLAGDADDLADEPTATLTAEGAVFGTTPFMSPEQVRGVEVDRRTDVWAFGCVLYEMLVRRRAFRTVAATLESDPDWTALPPRTPAALRHLLRRCLEKDPKRRLDSVAEARAVLDAVASGRATDSRWQRPVLAVAGLVAALAAAAACWALVARSWPARPRAEMTAGALARVRTRSVAVMDFANLARRDEVAWIGTALGEMMSAELRGAGTLRFIPGESVARMQQELALPAAGSYTIDTLARIRADLHADLVVTGDYLVDASRIRIDLRVQDARTGGLLASTTVTGAEDDLIGTVARLGEATRTALQVAAPADRRAGARASVPESARGMQLYADGLAALRAYQPWKARPLFEEALTDDPESPLVRLALARTYHTLGETRRAVLSARQALALEQSLPLTDRWRLEGQADMAAGDPAQAADAFGRLLNSDPDNLDYGLDLLQAQMAAGRSQDFAATLNRLRRLPRSVGEDPRLGIVEAAWQDKRADYRQEQAVAARAAEEAEARGARVLVARARAEESYASLQLGQDDRAAAAAREAQRDFESVDDRAGVAGALRQLALIAAHRGDTTGAHEFGDEALKIATALDYPDLQAQMFEALAGIEYDLGDMAAARRHHESAITAWRQLGTAHPEPFHNLADALQELGDLQGAEADERIALRMIPDALEQAFPLEGLARIRAARGDVGGAIRDEKSVIAVLERGGSVTNAAESRITLAEFLLDAGDGAAAVPQARSADSALPAESPQKGYAEAVLAEALMRQGDLAEALRLADRAGLLLDRTTCTILTLYAAPHIARVRAASRVPADLARARAALAADLHLARDHRLMKAGFRLQLALGELDRRAPATSGEGSRLLRMLMRDAHAQGFDGIAGLASRADVTPTSAGMRE